MPASRSKSTWHNPAIFPLDRVQTGKWQPQFCSDVRRADAPSPVTPGTPRSKQSDDRLGKTVEIFQVWGLLTGNLFA